MAMIETRKIEGGAVYGVEQVSYTVDGVSSQDYTAALTAACFKQAAAVEANMAALNYMVRMRQQKLVDLNYAMTIVTRANGTMKVEDGTSTDLSDALDELRDAADTARKYNVNIPLVGQNRNQIQRLAGQTAGADLKHAVDLESNALQQDLVSLQNLVQKRDTTYSTASSIVKRALNAGKSTIRAIGK